MRRRRLPLAVLLLSPGLLLGCGGKDGPAGPAAGGGANAGVPGIVLIVLDTLRADATASGRMPRLRAFAEQATTFTNASSSATWTTPALASALTGLEVSRHGAHGGIGLVRLPTSVPTVAALLAAAGWDTAAVTAGGWASAATGLDRGFARFSDGFDREPPAASIARWDRERRRDRPFFLLLHTYAAHAPYGRKDVAAAAAVDPARRAELATFTEGLRTALAGEGPTRDQLRSVVLAMHLDPEARLAIVRGLAPQDQGRIQRLCQPWLHGGFRDDPEGAGALARLRSGYEEGLASVDADAFDAALRALDAAALPAGTATIVLSDHGEAFGDTGSMGHGHDLCPDVVRVPLSIRAAGRAPAATRVEAACGLVDVAPTLLELAGLRAPPCIDGRSLLALARGERKPAPVVSESEWAEPPDGAADATSRDVVRRELSVRDGRRCCTFVVDPERRVVVRVRWYDLLADPSGLAPIDAPLDAPPLALTDARDGATPPANGSFAEFAAVLARVRDEALGVARAVRDPACGR